MVSLGPDTQSLNYTHMYSFKDLRSDRKKIQYMNGVFEQLRKKPGFEKFITLAKRANHSGYLNRNSERVTLFAVPDVYLEHIPMKFFETVDLNRALNMIRTSIIPRSINKRLLISSPVSYIKTQKSDMPLYVTNISGKTLINECSMVREYEFINEECNIVHVVDKLLEPSQETFMH